MSYDIGTKLRPRLTPTAEVLVAHYQKKRSYQSADFPLARDAFAAFQKTVVDHLRRAHDLDDWVVTSHGTKANMLEAQCEFEHIDTFEEHGVSKEIHLITLHDYALTVPVVICVPEVEGPAPGICCFSGHTRHGLKDLVSDLDSYQAGIATRLAQSGFVSIAVEKIDSGFLSRAFEEGTDEPPVASFNLAHGCLTRTIQLKACLAATELLAAHPRSDADRMGATGVSLGGWLSIETSLFTDRIKAIADFGRKTIIADPDQPTDAFNGLLDWCHIIPGILGICDRNLHWLAAAPVKMLAGHGTQDVGSDRQGYRYFRDIHL